MNIMVGQMKKHELSRDEQILKKTLGNYVT
jgi:hypothetical protein